MNRIDILSRSQIDNEAEKFLKKYRPNALAEATKLDLETLIENDLQLEIDYQNLDKNHRILGATIFRDGYMEVYNNEKKELKKFKSNTMIFDIELAEDYKQEGRFLFTLAHEIGHWVLHKKYFFIDERQQSIFDLYRDEIETNGIVCAKRNEDDMIIVKRKSLEEWIEWQADNFASSLLMPKEVFKFKYEELKKKIFEEEKILAELSNVFGASKKACKIRINILYSKSKRYDNQLFFT